MYKLNKNKIINKTKMFFILSSLGGVIITVASQDPRDKVIAQMNEVINRQREVMDMMKEVMDRREEAQNERYFRECKVKTSFAECTYREGKGGNRQSSETPETPGTSSWDNLGKAALGAVSDASKQIGQAVEALAAQTLCTLS